MIGREAITATDTEYRATRRRMEHLFVLLPFLGSALVAALAIRPRSSARSWGPAPAGSSPPARRWP